MRASAEGGRPWHVGLDMEKLRNLLASSRRADPVLLILLAALWVWKIEEFVGRSTGLLRRNLGWGFVVDLTIPIVFTIVLAVFFLVRHATRCL